MNLVADAVGGGDANLVELVEDVELGERNGLDPVPAHRGARSHRVEPARAARPAGGSAELVASLPQVLAAAVDELGGERAAPDAGRVRLEDAQDPADDSGGQPARGRGGTGEAPR